MKYLKAFEALAALFPKVINVTLVEAFTGQSLGKHKIPAAQLPTVFNRPTTLSINHINWRVLKADPVSADDFLYSKKLILQVQDSAFLDTQQLRFTLPSLAHTIPPTSAEQGYYDFNLLLKTDQWRQVEFLPLSAAGIVQKGINSIDAILNEQQNPLLGYEEQHIREAIAEIFLDIPFQDFCALLSNPAIGAIQFADNNFVQNSFAIQSDNHTYYGLIEGNLIRHLCLPEFDFMDDELMKVLGTYDLLLVDWCNTRRLSAEPGEVPKHEFIRL